MTNGESARFGERLWNWLSDHLGLGRIEAQLGFSLSEFWARAFGSFKVLTSYIITHPAQPWPLWAAHALTYILGQPTPEISESGRALDDLAANPSKFFSDLLADAATGGPLKETLETIGAFIYDSAVGAITGQPPPRDSEAAERARAFVGYVTALSATPQIVAAATETASIGQIDQLGNQVQQVYYNLGLGFLTWQVMAPILEAAILQPLERDVQRQWRGARFSLGQLQDLYALGEITLADLRSSLADLGWQDGNIDKVISLAFHTLSRSDIFKLFYDGWMEKGEAINRLRALGYDPEDIPLLFLLEKRDDVEDDKRESISTLTNAYRERLITRDEFQTALTGQGYTEREANLRANLVDLDQAAKRRSLSVAQLRDAWSINRVGDQEALAHLVKLGYPESEAQIILDTWRIESEPEFVRVNQATVLEMYRYAVLTRGGAHDHLVALGYEPDNANALITLEEARHPEAFGAPPSRKARFLSIRSLADLYQMGRIDESRVRQGVETIGFSGDDADYQVYLITSVAPPEPRPLSQSTIEDAYITGVFERTTAAANLADLGFSPEDAEIILDTVERANPAVFAPETITAVRQPSIGALIEAVRNGFIDEVEFFRRAQEIGLTRDGAAIYLENSRAAASKGSERLSKSDVLRLYKKGLLGFSDAQERLQGLGWSYQDADLLLRAEKGGVANSDVWQAMLSGLIEPVDAANILVAVGFKEADVIAAFEELTGVGGET